LQRGRAVIGGDAAHSAFDPPESVCVKSDAAKRDNKPIILLGPTSTDMLARRGGE
jgi:hypothetical protein